MWKYRREVDGGQGCSLPRYGRTEVARLPCPEGAIFQLSQGLPPSPLRPGSAETSKEKELGRKAAGGPGVPTRRWS